MFKSLYCKFLFYTTVKDRKKTWFAYDLFKLMPLYAVNSVQSGPSTTEDDIDVILYGYKPSGYTNGSDHAVIESASLIESLSLSHHLFESEFHELSNLIQFVHCYVFNPSYNHEDFYKSNIYLKKYLQKMKIYFNSYDVEIPDLESDYESDYSYLLHDIKNLKKYKDIAKFQVVSRSLPAIISKIKIHFIKNHNPIVEREIINFHTNCKWGESGTRIRLIDIDGNHFYKVEEFDKSDVGYYDLSQTNKTITERFSDFNALDDFSKVINATSLSLLYGFDVAEKGVIPNKQDKIVFDMELLT